MDTVSGRETTARGTNDGNQMQTLRIERAWTRMPLWAELDARAQGRRRPLRLVRVERVRTRMSVRPGWRPPAWNRQQVHLVRLDGDGNGMPLQPDKEARALSAQTTTHFAVGCRRVSATAAKQNHRGNSLGRIKHEIPEAQSRRQERCQAVVRRRVSDEQAVYLLHLFQRELHGWLAEVTVGRD